MNTLVVDGDDRDVRRGCGRARGGFDTQVVGLEFDVAEEVEAAESEGQHGRKNWNGSLHRYRPAIRIAYVTEGLREYGEEDFETAQRQSRRRRRRDARRR